MNYIYYRGAGPCRVLGPCEQDPDMVKIQQVFGVGGSVTIRLHRSQFDIRTRPLLSREEVENVFQILSSPPQSPPKCVWAKRQRIYREQIAEGLPDELAGLYRNLMAQKEPTFAERRVADFALASLVAEVSLVTGEDRSSLEQRIKKLFEKVERDLSPLMLREIPLDGTTKLVFTSPLVVGVSWNGSYVGVREDLCLGGEGADRDALRSNLEGTMKNLWIEFVRCPRNTLAPSGLRLRSNLKKYGKEFVLGWKSPPKVRRTKRSLKK